MSDDPARKCVQWTTVEDQKNKYISQQKQGYALTILGCCYLFGAFASSKTIRPVNTMALIVAGVIAMGVGIPLARRGDDSQVFEPHTQNLLTTGWASIIVPVIFYMLHVADSVYTKRTWYASKAPYNDDALQIGEI